jgi:phytoene synthase
VNPSDLSIPSTDAALRKSFAIAEETVRREAKNFYWGLRLTPEPRRSALYAIYAWMREGDDIVDEPARAGEFDAFKLRTREAFAGRTSGGLWPAFAHTVRTYGIDPLWLDAMLAGFAADLDHQQPATLAELEHYCYQVGSVVGLCCVSIWGIKGGSIDRERVLSLAAERGRAFQLTNVLRDIGTDARMQPARLYVPRTLMETQSVSRESLLSWSQDEACRRVVQPLIDRADRAYADSAALDRMVNDDCVPVLWTMTRTYQEILRAIASEPRGSVGAQAVRVPKWKKAVTMMVASTVRPWRWGPAATESSIQTSGETRL